MDFTNKPRLYDSSLWDLFGGGEESPRVPEAMAVNLLYYLAREVCSF